MPRLYVLSGDDLGVVREFESGAVIGRAPQVDLKIRGASISRQHARLEQRGGEWFVVDLGSSNGTRVGGRVVDEARLEDGDEFLVGDVEVRVRLSTTEPTVAPAAPAAPAAPQPAPESAGDPPPGGGDDFELEGDWDDSAPAPQPLPRPTRPSTTPRAAPTPSRAESDRSRRRAEAVGGPIAGERSTTSGGRILQYSKVENQGGLFGSELAQLSGGARAVIYLLVIAGVAALGWGAFQLTAGAKRSSVPVLEEE